MGPLHHEQRALHFHAFWFLVLAKVIEAVHGVFIMLNGVGFDFTFSVRNPFFVHTWVFVISGDS